MNLIFQRITPRALEAMRSWGEELAVVDVRPSAEFAAMHAPKAQSLPLEQLNAKRIADTYQSEDVGREQPLYLLCQSGYRSALAAEQLEAEGLRNVIVVDGGMERWAACHLPLVCARRRSILPMSSQVYLAVGAVLLLVTILTLILDPLWFLLTPVAGLGLIYAGVTRSCFLVNWLAIMPWNRGGTAQPAH